MGEEELDVCVDEEEQGLLPLICATSIQGRVALGPDLKWRGDELKVFDPTFWQIVSAIGLFLAGFALTRALGGRRSAGGAD